MDKLDAFVNIGTMFHTGEKAPVSGVYRFAYHEDGTCCLNYRAKFRITRAKGQPFPSHHRCKQNAIWMLEGFTSKMPEAR
jgi:hypothetical protein